MINILINVLNVYDAYPITAACIDHVEMLVMFLA